MININANLFSPLMGSILGHGTIPDKALALSKPLSASNLHVK